jgi:hypothetical protein
MRTLLMALVLPVFCAATADAGTKKNLAPKADKQKEITTPCTSCASDGTAPLRGERFESVPERPTRRSLNFNL